MKPENISGEREEREIITGQSYKEIKKKFNIKCKLPECHIKQL